MVSAQLRTAFRHLFAHWFLLGLAARCLQFTLIFLAVSQDVSAGWMGAVMAASSVICGILTIFGRTSLQPSRARAPQPVLGALLRRGGASGGDAAPRAPGARRCLDPDGHDAHAVVDGGLPRNREPFRRGGPRLALFAHEPAEQHHRNRDARRDQRGLCDVARASRRSSCSRSPRRPVHARRHLPGPSSRLRGGP